MAVQSADIDDYIIPSDNRELQLKIDIISVAIIISYQVITGNYNIFEPP